VSEPLAQPNLFGEAAALGYGVASAYDEMVTGHGHLRQHWRKLIGQLAPLDPESIVEREDEARRLLRQNGVTYSIYGDPQGAERLWPLDLIPLLISAEEWRVIEAGVIQRARLLNLILDDVYGEGRLVNEGWLPPALIAANPGFLRPCFGIAPPGGIYLHLCAIDIARAPDGRWWVLSDRTQAPSGAGYTLENRSVIGRVLADCLADSQVEPLAPFFAVFRETLDALIPRHLNEPGARPPRLVLLTPGPYNETYYEHVFLARQLGITLVEGADLTVRDCRVYLKTLNALEPVGVILRRLDDDYCDPLALRPESTLGVVGLTEAARAGNVAIANALGSGLLEAMAFKPFLPELSRRLLSDELLLPDVASWWCGEQAECRYVLDHLDHLVIKPAFQSLRQEAMVGADMSATQRSNLAARIAARPIDFVGQERLPASVAPAWEGNHLEPRPVVLRVYVAATADGFVVLPGGLTRTSTADTPSNVTMQGGAGSKDTWIVGGQNSRGDAGRMAAVALPQALIRPAPIGELSSRVADGLFWVGRYAERADGQVRLLRTLLTGVTDAARPWNWRDAEPLLNLAVWLELFPPNDVGTGVPISRLMPMIQAALVDPGHPSGIHSNLQRLARAASGVRDRLPPDCWRVATQYQRANAPLGARASPSRLLLRLNELVMLNASLVGSIGETMPRDAGWRFLDIGRRLERAIQLVQVLRGMATPPPREGVALTETRVRRVDERRLATAMLALTGTRLVALDRPDGSLDGPAVYTAVLDNPGDPRTLRFQLAALSDHLAALPRTEGGAERLARATAMAKSAQVMVGEAITRCLPPQRLDPREAFSSLDALLPEIYTLLADAYFTHARF
jgi:uncharacterized circularly permuted ATP-grasp superfamily protein/uncharacterized alpha-E superfamily protein